MPDRRTILSGSLVALAPALIAARDAQGSATSSLAVSDPALFDRKNLLSNYLRITADNSGALALNYWRGAYLVALPDAPPAIWFHLEGCEMRRCIPLGKDRYRSEYRIMTSIVDPATNAVLNGETWTNPYTGKEVTLKPNVSSADTEVWLAEDGKIYEQFPKAELPDELVLSISQVEERIYLTGFKKRAATRPATMLDYATITAEAADLVESDATNVPSVFHSSFLAPLFGYLEMPQGVGNATWHVSGAKLSSWDAIPARHRAEIAKWHPTAVDWALK